MSIFAVPIYFNPLGMATAGTRVFWIFVFVFVTSSALELAVFSTHDVIGAPLQHPPANATCATWCPRYEKTTAQYKFTTTNPSLAWFASKKDKKRTPLEFVCRRMPSGHEIETAHESDMRQACECAPFYNFGAKAANKWPGTVRPAVFWLHDSVYAQFPKVIVWMTYIKWFSIVEVSMALGTLLYGVLRFIVFKVKLFYR